MQITDINDFISTAAQLLNAPDLILIAVLLANVWLGARRGLVGALYGVIGRIAQWVVVPAVGQLFEKQAALKTAEGVLDGLRQTVTEAAVGMSESIAFSMLVVLFSVLFGRLIWIFGRSLKLIVRRTPLSALDSAGGALIGFVTGVAFVCSGCSRSPIRRSAISRRSASSIRCCSNSLWTFYLSPFNGEHLNSPFSIFHSLKEFNL